MCILYYLVWFFPLAFAIIICVQTNIFGLHCDVSVSGSDGEKPSLSFEGQTYLAEPELCAQWPLPPLLPLECSVSSSASADTIDLKYAADGHREQSLLCTPRPACQPQSTAVTGLRRAFLF